MPLFRVLLVLLCLPLAAPELFCLCEHPPQGHSDDCPTQVLDESLVSTGEAAPLVVAAPIETVLREPLVVASVCEVLRTVPSIRWHPTPHYLRHQSLLM